MMKDEFCFGKEARKRLGRKLAERAVVEKKSFALHCILHVWCSTIFSFWAMAQHFSVACKERRKKKGYHQHTYIHTYTHTHTFSHFHNDRA